MTHFLVHLLITQNTLFKHLSVSGVIITFKEQTMERCPEDRTSI